MDLCLEIQLYLDCIFKIGSQTIFLLNISIHLYVIQCQTHRKGGWLSSFLFISIHYGVIMLRQNTKWGVWCECLLWKSKKKIKKIRKLQREILDFFVWTVSTPFLFSGNIPCTPKVLLEMFITLLKYFHAALHRRQPKNNSSSSETCWLCTGSRSGFSRCSSCLCNALSTSLSLVSLQKCLCTLLNT